MPFPSPSTFACIRGNSDADIDRRAKAAHAHYAGYFEWMRQTADLTQQGRLRLIAQGMRCTD